MDFKHNSNDKSIKLYKEIKRKDLKMKYAELFFLHNKSKMLTVNFKKEITLVEFPNYFPIFSLDNRGSLVPEVIPTGSIFDGRTRFLGC